MNITYYEVIDHSRENDVTKFIGTSKDGEVDIFNHLLYIYDVMYRLFESHKSSLTVKMISEEGVKDSTLVIIPA